MEFSAGNSHRDGLLQRVWDPAPVSPQPGQPCHSAPRNPGTVYLAASSSPRRHCCSSPCVGALPPSTSSVTAWPRPPPPLSPGLWSGGGFPVASPQSLRLPRIHCLPHGQRIYKCDSHGVSPLRACPWLPAVLELGQQSERGPKAAGPPCDSPTLHRWMPGVLPVPYRQPSSLLQGRVSPFFGVGLTLRTC